MLWTNSSLTIYEYRLLSLSPVEVDKHKILKLLGRFL